MLRRFAFVVATLIVGAACSSKSGPPVLPASLNVANSATAGLAAKAKTVVMTVHPLHESVAGDIVQDNDGSVLFSAGEAFQRLKGANISSYPVIQDPYGFSASYTGALAADGQGTIYDGITWVDFYYSPEHSQIQAANIFPNGTTAGELAPDPLIDDATTVGGATDRLGNYWQLYNFTFFGFVGAYIVQSGRTVSIPPGDYQDPHLVDMITRGPANDMWVTGHNPYYTAMPPEKAYLVSSSGVIKTFTIPGGVVPAGIVADARGNLWYTDPGNNAIVELRLNGTFQAFTVPTHNASPSGIALGADGALWFTEPPLNRIGRITVHGHISDYAIPVPGTPAGIAGPDFLSTECKRQMVWFIEKSATPNDDAAVSIATRR